MRDMSFTQGLGRAYKNWHGDSPLNEFGFGLSYTIFSMAWNLPEKQTSVVRALSDTISLELTLTNTGAREGDEVVFVYQQPLAVDAPGPLPAKRVVAFKRFSL